MVRDKRSNNASASTTHDPEEKTNDDQTASENVEEKRSQSAPSEDDTKSTDKLATHQFICKTIEDEHDSQNARSSENNWDGFNTNTVLQFH